MAPMTTPAMRAAGGLLPSFGVDVGEWLVDDANAVVIVVIVSVGFDVLKEKTGN